MSVQELKNLNARFIVNDFCGCVTGPEKFEYIERGSKTVLSAPHATKTFVDGKVKASDLFTGALVDYIGAANGISTAVRVGFADFPCFLDEFLPSEILASRFFWDIHGMKDNGDFDLAIGTGLLPAETYQKELDMVTALAEKYGIAYRVNPPRYSGVAGMNAFTARLQSRYNQPQILQLEFSRRLRDFYDHEHTALTKTVPFLTNLVTNF